jgi:imidazolonepropionase-like amidohydrolase
MPVAPSLTLAVGGALVAAVVAASSGPTVPPRMPTSQQPAAQPPALRIRAGTLLDGRGGVQRDVVVTVRGQRIVAVAPYRAGMAVAWDLSGHTLLPGLIDTHVHIDGHFGPTGRADTRGETPEQRLRAAEENAQRTLRAGFTTVQSLGAPLDLTLREEIRAGRAEGPRLLTSVAQLTDATLSPDSLRGWVRATVRRGADVVKLFASKSIRDGGGQTMSAAQISAVCDEARKQGRRSWVHAHAASAVRDAALAGCTAVTHGTQVTAAELALMAERGHVLRAQHRAGDPELPGAARAFPGDRQLHRGGVPLHGGGDPGQPGAVPGRDRHPRAEGGDGDRRRGGGARTERARDSRAYS